MNELKRSYYAIIPANVRYDRDLPANAKLLYGEITALTNETGYCWASNKYFADLYKCTPQAISKWTKILEKKKYIRLEYTYKNNSKEIEQRLIYIVDEVSTNVSGVSTKKGGGYQQMFQGYQQMFKDNNTLNNTYKNNNNKTELFDYDWLNG